MRYIILLCVLLLVGCDITKQAAKTKSNTTFDESVITKSYRKGDTVRYEVPLVHYKDTVITTYNKQGTALKVIYDNSGSPNIECIASTVDEMKQENRKFQQDLLEKEKFKTEKLNTDWILYVVGGFVLIVFLGFYLTFKTINKNAAVLAAVLEQLKAR
jgi:CHASE3 domain sensor protein